jgi:HSP20 family protein
MGFPEVGAARNPATGSPPMSMMQSPISTWDPFRDLETFSRRLGGFFGRMPSISEVKIDGDLDRITASRWSPAVDVIETEEEYLIKAELPAIERNEVKVSVEEGHLVIEGERKWESEHKDAKIHRVERAYGSFTRSFRLPDDADATKVDAVFSHGVLTVHLPKTPASKPRQIEVKVK